MPSGFIKRGIGGFYYVETAEGITYECRARGIFRQEGLTPLPGDNVDFMITDPILKKGHITSIADRKSLLVRPQVANVDQVVAIFAVRSPEPDFLLLDKILIAAMVNNLDAVICINKIDLDDDACSTYSSFARQYTVYGHRLLSISARKMTGFGRLKELLVNKKSVFAGPSGVGKSTILNILSESIVMETGELSAKSDRGKHTTRHAELVSLASGGSIVDTPGFSALDTERMKCDDLRRYYPEFEEAAQTCRFKDCRHLNEPGCGVTADLGTGAISRERYDRYVHLFTELKSQKLFL